MPWLFTEPSAKGFLKPAYTSYLGRAYLGRGLLNRFSA